MDYCAGFLHLPYESITTFKVRLCQTVCVFVDLTMYDGLEGFPSREAHPPNMLITGHRSVLSKIFPALAKIVIGSRRHAIAAAINLVVP